MIGTNFINMQGQMFYNIEASSGLSLCELRKTFFLNELISVLKLKLYVNPLYTNMCFLLCGYKNPGIIHISRAARLSFSKMVLYFSLKIF